MKVACDEGVGILLRALAMAAYPDEGCGILLGSNDGDGVLVSDVINGHNLWRERSRDRYQLDPDDIVAAGRLAREHEIDIVGFWHSHPDHPAQPSQFDSERAWDDYVYLICHTSAAGSGDLNAFQLRDSLLQQIPLEIAETAIR